MRHMLDAPYKEQYILKGYHQVFKNYFKIPVSSAAYLKLINLMQDYQNKIVGMYNKFLRTWFKQHQIYQIKPIQENKITYLNDRDAE